MQSACLQLQNYLAVILIDIALHDDFDEFNGKTETQCRNYFMQKQCQREQ